MRKLIPHNRPTIGKAEKRAATDVLESRWLAQGLETAEFENEFCRYLGLPEGYAVAVSSGSAALYLALWVLGAKGKHIYFPGYACSALRNAVALAGAKALVGDIASGTPNLNMNAIPEEAKVVIAPHMFGIPCEINSLTRPVPVIEDCAQALGAFYYGRPAGTMGTVSVFSFYVSKMMTTGGQGGMFVSRDFDLVSQVRDYRQFDCRKDRNIRFNFQMTDLQAAIGRAQLRQLGDFIARREEVFAQYKGLGIPLLDSGNENLRPVRYRAIWINERPKKIIEVLNQSGIASIVPVEDWELLDSGEKLPYAQRLANETVSLPIYPSLKKQELAFILRQIERTL